MTKATNSIAIFALSCLLLISSGCAVSPYDTSQNGIYNQAKQSFSGEISSGLAIIGSNLLILEWSPKYDAGIDFGRIMRNTAELAKNYNNIRVLVLSQAPDQRRAGDISRDIMTELSINRIPLDRVKTRRVIGETKVTIHLSWADDDLYQPRSTKTKLATSY